MSTYSWIHYNNACHTLFKEARNLRVFEYTVEDIPVSQVIRHLDIAHHAYICF